VLQACRESRYSLTPDPEEEPRDRRVIKHQVVDIYGKTGAQAGVYVNWATDSVWIQRGCELRPPTAPNPAFPGRPGGSGDTG
jgi:hypothetical protein